MLRTFSALLVAVLLTTPVLACEDTKTFVKLTSQAERYVVDVLAYRCIRQTGGSSYLAIARVTAGIEEELAHQGVGNPKKNQPFSLTCELGNDFVSVHLIQPPAQPITVTVALPWNALPAWLTLTISFLTDFILTAGGTVSGGMIGADKIAMPVRAVWLLALVLGVMAGARRIQAFMTAPPGAQSPVTVVTTTTAPTPGVPSSPTTTTITRPDAPTATKVIAP